MPSFHSLILDIFSKVGYSTKEGLCFGFSMRWIEALIINEEHQFDEHIKHLSNNLINAINQVKAKKGQNLTIRDRELLNTLAFFDSLELYHSPEDHSDLFNIKNSSSLINFEFNSHFASSDKINALGGLSQIYSEPLIQTTEEIKQYLDDLSLIIESSGNLSKEPLGFVIISSSHAVALVYKPNMGWKFMDINRYPSQSFQITETELLAQRIASGFEAKEGAQPTVAFNTYLITTKNNPSRLKLTELLDQFKKKHKVTQEIASREHNSASLTYIAAEHGHVSVLAELAKFGVDLNIVINQNIAINQGVTPVLIAAQYGHASVITELAKYGADLNKASYRGFTPAHSAAQHGHASVIAELAKHGADLNKASNEGFTPAHSAALKGYASVIAELAKYGADLNKANNEGFTPAHYAAHNGHASVISELAKHGADLNKTINGGFTPTHYAAQHGHASVIAELAKHGADLNKTINGGFTPAHYAAQHGHASVIAELAKHGADLNKASNEGFTPALIAAQNGSTAVFSELIKYDANLTLPFKTVADDLKKFVRSTEDKVISRMNAYMSQQLKMVKTTFLMTPFDIAWVMGHKEILYLMKKAQFKTISMMVIGGFITALGVATVAIAFTLLNVAIFGVAGLVVAAIGTTAFLTGIGLFSIGTYQNRRLPADSSVDLSGNLIVQ